MILILVVCCASVVSSFVSDCPEIQIPPCECTSGMLEPSINCYFADDLGSLENSLRVATPFDSLAIRNVGIIVSNLLYIPQDLFMNFKLKALSIYSTTIGAFSDSDFAFRGQENSLEWLVIKSSFIMRGPKWHQLKDLAGLRELIFIDVPLYHIDQDIEDIARLNVTKLFLEGAQISYLYEKAFAKFSYLVHLSMRSNELKELKTSMFPEYPYSLEELDFSSNKISALPEDFFTNMPKLVSVSLADNAFTTIHEQVFLPIWSQLNKIDVLGNPMRCDCRLKWIVGKGMPKNFWGNCEEPQEVKGKEIKDLGTNDLWC